MQRITEAISTVLSLLLVMLVIYVIYSIFVIHTLLLEPQKTTEPVMTLNEKGKIIINGKETEYKLEETKVYRLRRIHDTKH